MDAVSAAGGGSVLPDGSELAGVYAGSVFVDGNATMTDDVTVQGSLIIQGDLENDQGHELVVRGSLYVQYMNFNRADPNETQSNITVDGDLILYGIDFAQTGGSSATLRVGGSLTGAVGFIGTYINGSGDRNTNGLDVLVYGDLRLGGININGGQTEEGLGNSGNGGQCTVYGDLAVFDYFFASGGPNNGTTHDAGNGGLLDVYGNATVGNACYLSGGNAFGANAGNGGYIEVEGNAVFDEIEMYGGDCNSNSENHRSGSGGTLDITGSIIVRGYTNLNGGERTGTLSAGNTLQSPDAGNTYVYGDFISNGDLDARGGDIFTNGFAPCNGGQGGNFSVQGDVFIDDLELNGGDSNLSDAGSGGAISIEGNFTGDDFENPGGSTNTSGNGGNGGSANVRGSARIGDLYMYGGAGNQGSGGEGGSLDVEGDLIVSSDFEMNGGWCNSTVETHRAGSGGNLSCANLNAEFSIYLEAGFRSGATTVSDLGVFPANGGSLNVRGNVVASDIYLNGSSVSTDYPNGPGGQGGSVSVDGNIICDGDLDTSGGSATANQGGRGGNVFISGHSVLGDVYANGGNSNDSILGGDATTNGAGANNVEFTGGATVRYLEIQDGTNIAAAAPTDVVDLNLRGHCTFTEIRMTDRSGVRIQAPNGPSPAVLKIETMPTKQTLNDSSGNPSDNISAQLTGSIFISGGGSWYAVQGTTIFTP
jgi:hypothetical protein